MTRRAAGARALLPLANPPRPALRADAARNRSKILAAAAELVAERGRLVVAGYHQDGPRQVNMQMWNWKGIDVINAHERDPHVYIQGMRDAIDAVVAGRLDHRCLITHHMPLNRLGDALAMTRDRPDGFLKAVVTI